MKLFGSFTSPFVRHCRVALEESGLEYELVETDYSQSAEGSATQRVPYFETQEGTLLHDSSSILKYIRDLTGTDFLSTAEDYDRFCLVNTATDACINIFLIEKEGFSREQVPYLQRQQNRIDTILSELNQAEWVATHPWNDTTLRLACFLDWALFRERLTLEKYPNLTAFLNQAYANPHFERTAPPKA